MKAIMFALMVGMIGITMFFGNSGYIAGFSFGTSTSDTFIKAVWPLAFGLAILVMAIVKGIGKKNKGG